MFHPICSGDPSPSSIRPFIASEVCPFGFFRRAWNTCSNRVTCPLVSPRCDSNACRNSGDVDASAVFGNALNKRCPSYADWLS